MATLRERVHNIMNTLVDTIQLIRVLSAIMYCYYCIMMEHVSNHAFDCSGPSGIAVNKFLPPLSIWPLRLGELQHIK